MIVDKFTFRFDDPRIAILLSPDLDFVFDRFIGSICQIVRPKHTRPFANVLGDKYLWQIFRNSILDNKRSFPISAWWTAELKMEAQVSNCSGLQAALAWHFRHTVIKCWCSEEIKRKCFENAGSDEWFAFMYLYSDNVFIGPSESDYSSESYLYLCTRFEYFKSSRFTVACQMYSGGNFSL